MLSWNRHPYEPESADAPPEAEQRRMLAWLSAAGVLMVVLGLAIGGGGSLAVLFGFVLMTHAAVVAASWLPPGRLSGRVDDFLDRWVSSVAGGWYGLVALAGFAHLEASALLGDLAEFSLTRSAVVDVLLPWLLGFSIESVWNMLRAGFWPLFLIREHGPAWAAVFAGASWATFFVGTRVFPTAPLPRKSKPAARDADAATTPPTPPPPPMHAPELPGMVPDVPDAHAVPAVPAVTAGADEPLTVDAADDAPQRSTKARSNT